MDELVNAGYWWTEDFFPAKDIDTNLFTHLFAAFADLDDQSFKVIIPLSKLDSISSFPDIIKQKSDTVKTLLSIGGDGAKSESFSYMLYESATREAFIESSIELARKHRYDGLDLHWLYPTTVWDMSQLVLLLKDWRNAVEEDAEKTRKPRLLLIASVYYSPHINHMVSYPNYTIMTSCLDWINVVAYDFETPQSFPRETHAHAAYFPRVELGLNEWINEEEFPSGKIVIVIPFHGWAWNLKNCDEHGILASADGAAKGQEGISNGGLGSYKSIRNLISKFLAREEYDERVIASFCYYENVWIGYEDEKCVAAKISKARELGLRGYGVWHIGGDTDDCVLARTGNAKNENFNANLPERRSSDKTLALFL